jgi:hypothetical protein
MRPATLLCVLMLAGGQLGYSQEDRNFDDYYRFPLSLGVEYQNLRPFADYGVEYTSYFEVSGLLRIPIPSVPVLQPFLQTGVIRFLGSETTGDDRWSHTHFYLAPGMAYAHRFSKNFEIGVDLAAGLSEAVFPNLDPAASRGSPTVLSALGARVSLDPSYSMSIDVHPSLKYLHSLTPLERFNGFLYSLGFSVNYRFGEDPDAPQAIIRSVKISNLEFPPLFAAMQSYYTKNPFGRVTITNAEKYPIYDVAVSFYQAGYMDTPIPLATTARLEAGESQTVEIVASFNEEIFSTVGVVPLTGEIGVDYVSRRRPASQSFSISYDLYDKTALTWDDDRKVGAFITPADSALRNYASFVRQSNKDYVLENFSEPLQVAIQLFYGLKELGCLYQIDPTSPFTRAQENPMVVDSISLPRDTLKRQTGDCDDLTVLFCSLLETVGFETAFITVPGHIFPAFNTKIPSRDYRKIHPDKSMTLNIDGELWVPVEVTMVGTGDFLTAWRTGIEEFAALEAKPEQRQITFTRRAQEAYRPVVLRETDLGLQYGNNKRIVDDFRQSMDKLVDQVIDSYTRAAQEAGHKEAWNRLGIVCAQYKRYAQAQRSFNTALALDRNFLGAKVNLGNLFYLRQEYQSALPVYHEVEDTLKTAGDTDSQLYLTTLLNIARTYYELENFEKATEYFDQVAMKNPALVQDYSYLSGGTAGGRAAGVRAQPQIRFAGEE